MTQQSQEGKELRITLDPNLINTCLLYMVQTGKAWQNIDRSFIHLYTFLTFKEEWHNENEIATKVKDFVNRPQLSVQNIKEHLDILSTLSVMEKKTVKGVNKFKISPMGVSMIMRDRNLYDVLKLFKVDENDTNKEDKQTTNTDNTNNTSIPNEDEGDLFPSIQVEDDNKHDTTPK